MYLLLLNASERARIDLYVLLQPLEETLLTQRLARAVTTALATDLVDQGGLAGTV